MTDRIHEMESLRNRSHVFRDRWEAGDKLAEMLWAELGSKEKGAVFAIPAGGVPVGLQVSRRLGWDFDCIIVRKVPIPGNPEAGFGAVALDGSVFLNEELLSHLRLTSSQIEQQIERVKGELSKRNDLFRKGRPLPDLSGRTCILVDDGLASGYTMRASIHTLRNGGAAEVIAAVPTAPLRSLERIQPQVDGLYCANVREALYFAVADAYEHWYDLSEKEVISLLAEAEGAEE